MPARIPVFSQLAPELSKCNDIHEYAKKLNSFIKCEALAGRWFKPKEKVNL
jgi:hypothetical protein